MRLPRVLVAASVLVWMADSALGDPQSPQAGQARRDLTELSLSELADLEVTTVSKRPERRSRAAAAVHVITREAIRRSGATTLAEALRLSPGLQVARIRNNQWAVGSRGFTSRLSRSMLVLIDGRSIYSPLFAGVYWEVQDLLLEPDAPFREGSPPRTVVPFVFRNGLEGSAYGGEVSADVQAWDGGRLFAAYSYLRLDLRRQPGSTDASQEAATEGASPRHQLYLRSSLDLPGRVALDAMLRRSSALPGQRVDTYTSLDARLAWRATHRLELAAVGQNLLADHHLEFGGASLTRTEAERGVYAEAIVRW